jgi:hypothetical protein
MAKYDPETLTVLRIALDEAWALLPDDRKSESQKSDMAQRILKKAAEGVRGRRAKYSYFRYPPPRDDDGRYDGTFGKAPHRRGGMCAYQQTRYRHAKAGAICKARRTSGRIGVGSRACDGSENGW